MVNATPAHPAGLLLIDKPSGISSFDVIRRLRRQTGIKKAGHAGTLDPMATGLMLILVGSATKQADRLLKQDKSYRTTIRLGATSDTGDAEGELTSVSTIQPTLEEVQQTLKQYIGEITQTPPAYSAIKINGVRAYQRARRGETVEMPSRQVTIHRLDLIDYTYPDLTVEVEVSSGTYIRTLGEDIGKSLGVGGYLTALRRLTIGDYTVDGAVGLDSLTSENLSAHLMKL